MTNTTSLVSLSFLTLAACGSSSASNPPKLWLAPDNSELVVKLADTEPPPY